MAVQNLYASSFSSNTGLLTPNNALGSGSSDFTTNVDAQNFEAVAEFASPSEPMATGSSHLFIVNARKEAGTGTPTLTVRVESANGTILEQITHSITSTTGANYQLPVAASKINAASGGTAGIRVRLIGTSSGGGPSVRSTPQLNTILWTGDFYTPVTTPDPGFYLYDGLNEQYYQAYIWDGTIEQPVTSIILKPGLPAG
jgi:hypothetical protein